MACRYIHGNTGLKRVGMYCATEMVAPTLNVFPSSSLRLRLELPSLLHSKLKQARFPFPSFSLQNPTFRPVICRASESPTVPPKKRSSNNRNPKNNSKKNSKSNSVTVDSNSISNSSLPPPLPTSLPKPPTGFVVDERGKVLSASRDRLATLVSFSFPFFYFYKLNENVMFTEYEGLLPKSLLWLWTNSCDCAILIGRLLPLLKLEFRVRSCYVNSECDEL